MSEKVIISDLSSLHVCPSSRWGTLEKKTLTDCLFLRDSGANPIIFCLANSIIDKAAEKEDIARIHYSGKKITRSWDFHYFIELKKILDDREVDLIHCYHLPSIWIVCWLLNSNPLIPLVLTTDSVPSRRIQSVLHKWLARRIDALICFSPSDREFFGNMLPIPTRKMRYFGMGIDVGNFQMSPANNRRVIGCFIDHGDSQEEVLKKFLLNIDRIREITNARKIDIDFHFFFEEGSQESTAFKMIEDFIRDHHLSEHIHLAVAKSFATTLNKINIFISLDDRNVISYEEMIGIIGQKLVLMPRTAARVDLLTKYGKIAQTYDIDNAREMSSKLLYLLENETMFWRNLQTAKQNLYKEHGAERYINEFFGLYERLLQRRIRLSNTKKLAT